MRKIIIATILLLSFLNLYPNNETEITENQNQYEKLIDLAKTYFYKNTEYAFNCAYKAHAIAEENQDNAKQSECNIIMGNIFRECSSYPTAISYYEKAIENLIKLKENHTICKLYIRIAKLYQNGEFDSNWCIEAMNNAILAEQAKSGKSLAQTQKEESAQVKKQEDKVKAAEEARKLEQEFQKHMQSIVSTCQLGNDIAVKIVTKCQELGYENPAMIKDINTAKKLAEFASTLA